MLFWQSIRQGRGPYEGRIGKLFFWRRRDVEVARYLSRGQIGAGGGESASLPANAPTIDKTGDPQPYRTDGLYQGTGRSRYKAA